MLKRKIEKTLLNWLNTENRNPLILKGCRQCGKTFSVLRFAQQHYKHVVYLNFFENPDYKTIFEGSLKVDWNLAAIGTGVPNDWDSLILKRWDR